MQPLTSLSSTMFYTAGMLLSLSLVNELDMSRTELANSFSSETIKYLSKVDDKIVYLNKIKSALAILKENIIINSFDISTENTSAITTFLIKIPKSKDISKLVNTNMAITNIFDNIPENDREQFTTVQKMV